MRAVRVLVGVVLAVCLAAFLWNAARLLSISDPQPSDVILVLNGGTEARVQTALRLLRQGEAPKLVIETGNTAMDWGVSDLDLARQWVARLPPPDPSRVSLCPVRSFSTRQDERMVQPCLGGSRTVLIVTSQYHTRRALSIFSTLDHSRRYTVAGAVEPTYFGTRWWTHREWAKTVLQEWSKLVWWEAVDRWR